MERFGATLLKQNGTLCSEQLRPLHKEFFARNTVKVARDLIGKCLVHHHPQGLLVGKIVETEAYTGDDPACHAFANAKRLALGKPISGRSAQLFGPPARAYVYFNYGMYWLFNVVTEREGVAGAVLVRAVEPIVGVEIMRRLRPKIVRDIDLTNGPGKLTLAMGIGRAHNDIPLDHQSALQLCENNWSQQARIKIVKTTRVGVSKGQDRLWRFIEAGNPYVSKTPLPKVSN